MGDERYTLFQLNALVRDAIEMQLDGEYWVQAELAECRESRGHCYMELVEKDSSGNTPIARASAKCWRSTWALLQPYFERTTGQQLRAGMKVLLRVSPQFHEAFGFSWIVSDIDPTFTLGDLARRRMEIIAQLKAEGVFDLQRDLQLPLFCQHIAVISSPTAAGYGDFCNQLSDNPYGFCFSTQLFEATMQGEQVEQSVIAALNSIYESAGHFDCVVIIRGGGATSDLSGFDTLSLAENVANFPLPVITGIGHDRDESIIDMVAHTHVKTPTAAAALLISHLEQVLSRIGQAEQRMGNSISRRMETEKLRLDRIAGLIPHCCAVVKTQQNARLEHMETIIRNSLQQRTTTERHRLDLLQQRVKALDPTLLLRRGYSITLHNGRIVRQSSQLKSGDELETRLADGTIRSTVHEPRQPHLSHQPHQQHPQEQ